MPETAIRNCCQLDSVGEPEVADLSGCRKSIQLAIAGIRINALIDTRAARSLMADSVFQDICTRTNRSSLLRPSGAICSLGGKPLDVIGETELLITDAGPVNVMVTRGLPHQLLLASDAIAVGHGVLDYENMRLQWYGRHYVLYDYPDYAPILRQCTCIKPVGSKLLTW